MNGYIVGNIPALVGKHLFFYNI